MKKPFLLLSVFILIIFTAAHAQTEEELVKAMLCSGPVEGLFTLKPLPLSESYELEIDGAKLVPCLAFVLLEPAPGETFETRPCEEAEDCAVETYRKLTLDEQFDRYTSRSLELLGPAYDAAPLVLERSEVPFAFGDDEQVPTLTMFNGEDGFLFVFTPYAQRLTGVIGIMIVVYPYSS